jgi:hypothetical protein
MIFAANNETYINVVIVYDNKTIEVAGIAKVLVYQLIVS